MPVVELRRMKKTKPESTCLLKNPVMGSSEADSLANRAPKWLIPCPFAVF